MTRLEETRAGRLADPVDRRSNAAIQGASTCRTSAYLRMVRVARQGRGGDLDACGRLKTAHSKVEPAAAGLRRKRERVNVDRAAQALASSSSRRTWKARLPILRATVSRATDGSRRARVAR